MTLEQAKIILRIDTDEEDFRIQSLLDAVPIFIQEATGLTVDKQADEPLVEVVTRFLICEWYEPDTPAAPNVISSLLKTVKARADE